jgi:periplasmic divalent cation tolerance protein
MISPVERRQPEPLVVTLTAPTAADAERLGRLALQGRLAACAQVHGPITSSYWWNGEITTSTEWACTLKTTRPRLSALVTALKAAHPYEVPEIVVTAVTGGDPEYLAWLRAEADGGAGAASQAGPGSGRGPTIPDAGTASPG